MFHGLTQNTSVAAEIPQKNGSSDKLVSPTARLMRGWFPPTVNPEGLRPPAQGCEERATLGNRAASQPQRGCGPARHPRTQFRCGWLALARCTQGSSQSWVLSRNPSGLWRPRFQISKENAPNGGLANPTHSARPTGSRACEARPAAHPENSFSCDAAAVRRCT